MVSCYYLLARRLGLRVPDGWVACTLHCWVSLPIRDGKIFLFEELVWFSGVVLLFLHCNCGSLCIIVVPHLYRGEPLWCNCNNIYDLFIIGFNGVLDVMWCCICGNMIITFLCVRFIMEWWMLCCMLLSWVNSMYYVLE